MWADVPACRVPQSDQHLTVSHYLVSMLCFQSWWKVFQQYCLYINSCDFLQRLQSNQYVTNICINNLLSKLRECYQQGLLYLSAAAMSSEQAIFNSVPVSTLHILLSWAPTNLRGYQYCILCMSSCVLFEGQEGPPEQPISEEYLYPYSVVKADERYPARSLVYMSSCVWSEGQQGPPEQPISDGLPL